MGCSLASRAGDVGCPVTTSSLNGPYPLHQHFESEGAKPAFVRESLRVVEVPHRFRSASG